MIFESVKERARLINKTIVLPESNDVRMLKASVTAVKENLARIILLGQPDVISGLAAGNGINLSGVTVLEPAYFDRTDDMAAELRALSKSNALTLAIAKEMLRDNIILGMMMVKKGIADGMVIGSARHMTDVLRPALDIIGAAPEVSVVSSCFIISMQKTGFRYKSVYAFADCALNENPTADELASIAVSTAKTYKSLSNEEPIVAMLSHSTKGSSGHPDAAKAAKAVKLAKVKLPGLIIDGEMQADAALIPSAGMAKAPGSIVAGRANVLVFPNLDAASIGYKLVEHLAGANAYGPITQGLALPVNSLSQDASVDDIVGSIAITALQSGN
ncbi:MAG: phosphotransacetylase [Clostridiales bacterium]|jgi:phosphate acetyltransferase|nr:phosphotransacetylase [Clostridiales bacterium]